MEDIDAEIEEWRRQSEAENPAREPVSPLVTDARWTSTDIAVQLIADSQAFYADWTVLQGQAPYALYHYTDASALNEIIESGRLHASDLLYLAGSRETDYVRDLIRDQIGRRWNRADALVSEFCERAEAALDPFTWDRSIFAACFCENGDALGQWRAYAGPRGGYAIGEQLVDRPDDAHGIVGQHGQPVVQVAHDFAQTADARSDHVAVGGHRL